MCEGLFALGDFEDDLRQMKGDLQEFRDGYGRGTVDWRREGYGRLIWDAV